ncbi:hypothetical protein GR7B_00173 [Vibrio phage vB_VcorM_GR7B]|nr:hypothetical protein GR7B_00173 [Vibrio phage vB_VcorM_GR7B]
MALTKEKAKKIFDEHLAARKDGNFMTITEDALALLTNSQRLNYYQHGYDHLGKQIDGLGNTIMQHFSDEMGTELDGKTIGINGACEMASDLLATLPAHRENTKKIAELNVFLQESTNAQVGKGVVAEVIRLLTPKDDETFVLNAGEALFGFAGWLTSRDEVSKFGSSIWATPAADMVAEFIKANNLSDTEIRDEWSEHLVHPTWTLADSGYPEESITAYFSRGDEDLPLLPLACYLWGIIDDIDTAFDVCKDNDVALRESVQHLQNKRWKTGVTTDGHRLLLGNINVPKHYVEGTDYSLSTFPEIALEAETPSIGTEE